MYYANVYALNVWECSPPEAIGCLVIEVSKFNGFLKMVLANYNKNANVTEDVVDAIPRKVWVVRFCKAQKRDVCTCGTPKAYSYI